MSHSPGQSPREQIGPPRESTGRWHRTGYLSLAASGLALCTAFAAIAHITQPEDPADTRTSPAGRSTGGGAATELVPGDAVPAEATVVVDGVAVTATMPSSDSPTTIITTDENGTVRSSVHGPPDRDRESSRSTPPRQSDPPPGTSVPSSPTDDPGPNPTESTSPSDPSEPPPPSSDPSPTDPEIPEPSDSPTSTTGGGSAPSASPTSSGAPEVTGSPTSASATTSPEPGSPTGTSGTDS